MPHPSESRGTSDRKAKTRGYAAQRTQFRIRYETILPSAAAEKGMGKAKEEKVICRVYTMRLEWLVHDVHWLV